MPPSTMSPTFFPLSDASYRTYQQQRYYLKVQHENNVQQQQQQQRLQQIQIQQQKQYQHLQGHEMLPEERSEQSVVLRTHVTTSTSPSKHEPTSLGFLCNTTECADQPIAFAESPLPTPLVSTLVVATLLVVIFTVSLTINLTVLFMFWRRKLRMTVSSRFLLNLSVCHVITAIFILPCAFISLLLQTWVFGDVMCHMIGFILNLVIAASTLTLIAIAVDRHCAIVSPLHYSMKLTTRRCHAMICGVWIISLVCALPPIFGWNHMEFRPAKMICTVKWTSHMEFDSFYNLFIVAMCFVVPLAVLIWVYAVIFRAAKANIKRTVRRKSVQGTVSNQSTSSTQSQPPPPKPPGLSHGHHSTPAFSTSANYSTPQFSTSGSTNTCSAEGSPALSANGRRRSSVIPIMGRRMSIQRLGNLLWYREERKTAVTCTMIFMAFIGCWLPYFTVILIETFSPSEFSLPDWVDTFSILMALSSCALDPLLYVVRNSQLRKEFSDLFKRHRHENNMPSPQMI